MTDLSKLSNLFNAQQRRTAYYTSSKKRTDEQKELADVNGDGKINYKDSSLINKQISDIKKDNPYDLNSDGKTNITDWLLLGDEIDLDGDGTVSDAEKTFIANQKKTMASTVQKSVVSEKYTGEFNGKYYANGKTATGIYEGTYYRNGVKGTGIANNTYYKNGVPATGSYSGKYYVEGSLANGKYNDKYYSNGKLATGVFEGTYYRNGVAGTGTCNNIYYVNGAVAEGKVGNYMYQGGKKLTGTAEDGLYYKNGSLYSGNIYNDTNTTKYTKGVMQYSVTDNNKSNYPNLSSSNIRFRNGGKYTNIALQTGDSVVINKDGMTEITDKSGSAKLYDSTGALFSGTYNDKTYENGVEIEKTLLSEPVPTIITTETTTTTGTTETTPTTATVATTATTETTSVTSDTLADPNVEVKGTEYSLADLKEITVNGKTIKVDGPYWKSKGKIIVEDNGRINIYVEDLNSLTFDTTENLDIVLRKCDNHYFSLNGGSGNDNITISRGVDFYSINGKDGDDTIVNYANTSEEWGKGGMISGDKGNDTIKNYGTVYTLDGGEGNDTLINDGIVSGYFTGGEGNDTMINDIHGVTKHEFQGGDGNDTVINKGTSAYIDGDEGDDTIQNFGTSSTIDAGEGNDKITNEASGIARNIWGKDGDDTIINHGVVEQFLDGDKGNDILINDGVVGSSIYGSDGNDTIDNSNGIVKDYIDGGYGTDTLIGDGNHGGTIWADDFENLSGDLKSNIDGNQVDAIITKVENATSTASSDTKTLRYMMLHTYDELIEQFSKMGLDNTSFVQFLRKMRQIASDWCDKFEEGSEKVAQLVIK